MNRTNIDIIIPGCIGNEDDLCRKTFEFNYKGYRQLKEGYYIPCGDLFGYNFLKEVCKEFLDEPEVTIWKILQIISLVLSAIQKLKEPTSVIFNIMLKKDKGFIREPDERDREEVLFDRVWFGLKFRKHIFLNKK